jgi:two-component system response regulator RegA
MRRQDEQSIRHSGWVQSRPKEAETLAQTSLPSVLVVDGERHALEALAQQFRDKGWSVATADGCAQALLSSSVVVPDWLVVERDLGDGSAFSLFERLRTVNPDLSAVMVTRQPSIAEAVRAIHAGFFDYRSKSLDCSGLLDLSEPHPLNAAGSLARVEWNYIQRVLTHSRGNISEAARVLGLHRRSLQRKLRKAIREGRHNPDRS